MRIKEINRDTRPPTQVENKRRVEKSYASDLLGIAGNIWRLVGSNNDCEQAWSLIIDQISALFSVNKVAIMTCDNGPESFQIVASRGLTGISADSLLNLLRPSLDKLRTSRSPHFLDGHIISELNSGSTAGEAGGSLEAMGFGMLLPLVSGCQAVGCLLVADNAGRELSWQDSAALNLFAELAVVVLNYSRVYHLTAGYNAKLELVKGIAELVSGESDLTSVLEKVASVLKRVFDAQAGAIFTFENKMEPAIIWGSATPPGQPEAKVCKEIVYKAIGERRPVSAGSVAAAICRDDDSSPGKPEKWSAAGVPVLYKNEVLGAIVLFSMAEGRFSREELDFLGVFGNQLAIVVHNFQINAKLIETELALERAANKAIIEAAGDGIFVVDSEMVIQVFNSALEKITGLSADKVVGNEKCYELIKCAHEGESLCIGRCPFERTTDNQPQYRTSEITIARREPDGHGKNRVKVEVTYSAVIDRGGLRTGIAVVRDMPQLKFTRDEMRIAREIQSGLLPEAAPAVDGHDLHFICRPAAQVGGDCLDFIPLSDGRIGISISDIAGKSLPAALLVSMHKGLLRSSALRTGSVQSPLEELNERILADTSPEVFITMIYGIYDPQRATFTYANAGHVPPILYRKRRCTVLQPPQPPLGVGDDFVAEQCVVRLFKGDALVLVSDGVLDARSENGRFFGIRSLCRIIKRHPTLPAEELANCIYRRVKQFAGHRLQDDFTLMILRCNREVETVQVSELIVENRPAAILDIRRFVMSEAARLPFSRGELSDIDIAIGEAVTNAIMHGQSPDEVNNRLKMTCEIGDDYLKVRIADNGVGFAPDLACWKPPKTFGDRGRGIYLMKALVEEVGYETLSRGTAVVLLKRCGITRN
ncbi:MAG: SpoIIE family protein phosphatase [Actinobacteria bacterium]|nr:SpoIIE family protein phosphatase [Actinomycetota bacterium]